MCFRNTGRKTRRSIYTTSLNVCAISGTRLTADIGTLPPASASPVISEARRRGASGSAASARRAKPQRVVGQTCDCAKRKGFASANPVACEGTATALTIAPTGRRICRQPSFDLHRNRWRRTAVRRSRSRVQGRNTRHRAQAASNHRLVPSRESASGRVPQAAYHHSTGSVHPTCPAQSSIVSVEPPEQLPITTPSG